MEIIASLDRSTLGFCAIMVIIGLFHMVLPGVARGFWNTVYRMRVARWQERGGWRFDPDRPHSQSLNSRLWSYRFMGVGFIGFAALVVYYTR